jgi:hypothetical protein
MLDAFARSPELILLYSNAVLVGARRERLPSTQFSALGVTGQELALVRSGHAFDALLHRNLVTGATAAFRREVFELARPFPREWVHDEWIAAIASALGRVDFIADALIEYRQHASNEIGMRPLSVTERFENLFRKRGDFCAREASRGQILLDRLIALGDRIPPDKVHRPRERIAHLQFRDRLPRRRLARAVPVAREALTGRYAAYGRGLRSILRDLLEPL